MRRLTPSFGCTWVVRPKKSFFLGIKLFFFQDGKLKPYVSLWSKISWNLTKFQLIQLIQSIVIYIFFYQLSDWVVILWAFMKSLFKEMLKVSAFYLEKQKSFVPKKKISNPLSISKQNSFVYCHGSIFREGFVWSYSIVFQLGHKKQRSLLWENLGIPSTDDLTISIQNTLVKIIA